jgi:hypothetical protein
MTRWIGWLGLAFAFTAHAAPPDALTLILESERRMKSQTETTRYRMELFDAQGALQHTRELELYYKRQPKVEATLLKFTAPPVLQGTGLLITDRGEAINDIWLYLPATRRIRRIAGAEKTNWFMGTEFTHEDFEDYKPTHYDFSLIHEQIACGTQQHCAVIAAVARDATEREHTGYSKKIYWIEQQSLYPIRIDYIDRKGQPAKQLEIRTLVRVGAYWRPERYEMRNLANGRTTRLTALARELDAPLDDLYVSQRFLRTD